MGRAAGEGPAGEGAAVAARWRTDPQQAAALAQELAADGEFTAGEILDQAVDAAVLEALLTLRRAGTVSVSDPGAAAGLCLHAVPHLALAAALAGADAD
ncbi:hypothetical protein BV881_33235 [Streptomyces sp. ZL-24]|uniref:hypothetical protein n=1 Tax=Streptomyces TaxID=1883 RepID=UPI000D4F6A43|nr:hypothetical protein [Streptomyces sp. ZL-24]POG43191.1 hypothetical protein BV881_33235 [Streptomyces sp. ZL-24]